MFGLSIIDLLVIVLYFAAMIAIGIWSMRRIKNREDYFLAGRRFGKFIQTFAAFGQATSPDTAVAVTTTTFTNGASGTWSSLLYLFATPIYWLVCPWTRRLRLLTQGDFFEERYGSRPMAGAYAVVGTVMMMMIICVGFSAMTKTIIALSPKAVNELSPAELAEYKMAEELSSLRAADYETLDNAQKARLDELLKIKPRNVFSHIDKNILIWVVCAIVMAYAVAGGLEAAYLTDTIQGMFIIILSIILIPFGWAKINSIYGGSGPMDALRTIHSRLPESFFEVFGSPTTVDFTWYYIIALSIMGTLNAVAQPNFLSSTASAKDEYTSRFGFVTGSFMKRICTILWGFFALSAVAIYYDKVSDSDLVWGYATLDLLGPFKLGLIGLMIACLMAALMSTASCLMITSSSLITLNIYRPIISNRSERHYIVVGGIIGGLVVVGGAFVSTRFETILQILKFMWEINVVVAASLWLGMKWRRANKTGAWCSITTAAMLFYIIPILLPAFWPGLRTEPALLKMTNPGVEVRVYRAKQMDVEARQQEIDKWGRLNAVGKATGNCPQHLEVGQKFEKKYILQSKSIFWTRGIKFKAGNQAIGCGDLSPELLLLDKLGFNLADNPYALNETIRIMIRTGLPFVILIVVSLLTRPDDKKRLDAFFAKMRTPVRVDRQEDAKELALSLANPTRLNHTKLFPNSDWEFDKWDKVDTIGFLVSVLMVGVMILLLMFLVSVGR